MEQHPHLVALDRLAQVAFEHEPVGALGAHMGAEHLDAVAALALGLDHRDLGVLQHLVALLAALVQGEADGDGEEDLPIGVGDRRRDGPLDHAGEGEDPVGVALREQDHRELVAGEAGERILWPQQPAEAAGQGEQDRVARRKADGVVDAGEAVDVEDERTVGFRRASWPAKASAASSRSPKSSRFGRPVRLSCTASCSRRSSAVFTSVTSAMVPTTRITSPSAPITGRA